MPITPSLAAAEVLNCQTLMGGLRAFACCFLSDINCEPGRDRAEGDPKKAEAAKKGLPRVFWRERENRPETHYLTPDPNKVTQMPAIPRGLEFWKLLAAVINCEPVLERDRFFTAMSKPLGIEKG